MFTFLFFFLLSFLSLILSLRHNTPTTLSRAFTYRKRSAAFSSMSHQPVFFFIYVKCLPYLLVSISFFSSPDTLLSKDKQKVFSQCACANHWRPLVKEKFKEKEKKRRKEKEKKRKRNQQEIEWFPRCILSQYRHLKWTVDWLGKEPRWLCRRLRLSKISREELLSAVWNKNNI